MKKNDYHFGGPRFRRAVRARHSSLLDHTGTRPGGSSGGCEAGCSQYRGGDRRSGRLGHTQLWGPTFRSGRKVGELSSSETPPQQKKTKWNFLSSALGSPIGTALVGSPTEDSGALKKHVRRSTFFGEKVGGCQRAYKRASAHICALARIMGFLKNVCLLLYCFCISRQLAQQLQGEPERADPSSRYGVF